MLTRQRDVVILNMIEQRGFVTVADICSHCNCSAETARRDLRRLDENNLLARTHGGAMPVALTMQASKAATGTSLVEARNSLVDRADVLVVTPDETKATRLMIERARRAGVPIIAEAISHPLALTTVAVDDYRAGFEAGRWVVEYARRTLNGKVMVLDVSLAMPNTTARSRGFADGLLELAPRQRQIIRVSGQGLRKAAKTIVADALRIYTDINVIFGINDDSALGGLDAYREAELDESKLVVVSIGLGGYASMELLHETGPRVISVAMFPELVGRACIDAALCAYHNCPLPERISPPFVVVSADTFDQFYQRDSITNEWSINWTRAKHLPTSNTGYLLLNECHKPTHPKSVGFVQIYSSHEWYQNVRRAMHERAQSLGIALEVVDASQNLEHELDTLKQRIGRTAANYVQPGDVIILDAGVTTRYLAHALRGRHEITVITNSLAVLNELADEKGITLVASGGAVRQDSQSLTGPGAEATFQGLRADKAFIAASGVSLDFGLSNTNILEAAVKQAMIGAAREVILITDYSKIGADSIVRVAPIDCIDKLITDEGISTHDRMALTQRGIDVLVAE